MEAPEIQNKIDAFQEEFHDKCEDVFRERDLKKNEVYAVRTKLLKEKGPKNFWSVIISAHPDISSELMGPYDPKILEFLTDFDVRYTAEGYKLTMTFAKNPFFSDTTLSVEDANGDYVFSGINWKDGKGPYTEEEEDEMNKAKAGQKRDRDDDRGPSLFEVFSTMPPHPDEDEELDEEDEEEIEELIDEWEEDLEDRKEVLSCLVEEVWADPAQILSSAVIEGDK